MSIEQLKSSSNIASTSDVIDYLSCVMLGNSKSSAVICIKEKNVTFHQEIFKPPSEKERLKACELLIKIYDSSSSISNDLSCVIIDDISTHSFHSPLPQRCDSLLNSNPSNTSNSPCFDPVFVYLSSVMLGNSSSSILVNVKNEFGAFTEEFKKSPSEDERLKSAEMLVKLYNSFSSDNNLNSPVILNSNSNSNSISKDVGDYG